MVCSVTDIAFKDDVITTKAIHPGLSLGDCNGLHETPIQDPGMGVKKIHVQLQNLCLEMKILK